jgi:hypothetical protein
LAGEKGEPGIVRPYGGPRVETAALPNTHDVTENGMAMEANVSRTPQCFNPLQFATGISILQNNGFYSAHLVHSFNWFGCPEDFL